ncbi:uncharacterized protein JN550_001415 [Neoarthrinium moseri]|uniref:uncharacterized protein n=1 Tax=Neoarthrinium moseri TaxID=1658444 RepID=UPI001FDE743B|nr:uncharacterized protein JN550_001415 [Neoarthrinium moseri]KAI1875919.1 hypothetical protein JN550_001415 [Neoarthrinium moseri]
MTLAQLLSGVLLTFSPPIWLGLAVSLCILASYAYSWSRLRHIKGPWLGSFSYLWMLYYTTKGKQAVIYRAINQNYGHLARIGPNDLITDDPDIVRRMNAARSPYKRSSWYEALRMNPYQDSLFSMGDTAAHDKLKAQLSFGYGGKENPTIEDGIDEQLGNLHGLIRRKYLSTDTEFRPMDLATAVQYFTLDTITRIAYGKEFGYLEADSDLHAYIRTSEEQVPFLTAFAEIPWMRILFFSRFVLRFIGPKKTDRKGIGRLLGVADRIIEERLSAGAEEKQDMLSSFIRHGVTRDQLEGELLFQIVAGSDTTATALRGTMLHLMSAPNIYHTLQREIDEAIFQGKISSPAKAEEGKELEYLQAVIYEGLRMNIPFSGLCMKQVPPGGDTLLGQFVPGGTRVAHNMLGMQRSRDVFGDDADLFRPERWLGIDAEKKKTMMNVAEMVFGYGRFGCSGKPVAIMELNKAYIEASLERCDPFERQE